VLNLLFPIVWKPWERSTRKNESHMNWSQETLKRKKLSVKFCLLDNKERGFCIVSLLGLKNGFILTTPDVEKPVATPIQFSTLTSKWNIHEKKNNALYLVGSEGCSVWIVKIWSNNHRGSLLRTNYPFWVEHENRSEYETRQHKVILLHNNGLTSQNLSRKR